MLDGSSRCEEDDTDGIEIFFFEIFFKVEKSINQKSQTRQKYAFLMLKRMSRKSGGRIRCF